MNSKIFIKTKEGYFLKYKLNDRYQNSISWYQLQGKNIDESKLKEDCDPIVYNKDVFKDLNPKVLTFNTKALNPDDIAYPCGLMAKSIFTD